MIALRTVKYYFKKTKLFLLDYGVSRGSQKHVAPRISLTWQNQFECLYLCVFWGGMFVVNGSHGWRSSVALACRHLMAK